MAPLDDSPDPSANPQAEPPAPSNQSVGVIGYTLCGVPLEIHVLSNGQRVITADSFAALILRLESGEADPEECKVGLEAFGRFLQGLPTPGGEV